jgi:uncharacterized protein (DUF1684 family)
MSGTGSPLHDLQLVDWRRRVGDLYRLRGPDALPRFRAGRDELFGTHPQSAIPADARAAFTGLRYFDADPAFRVTARMDSPDGDEPFAVDTGGDDGVITYRRAGVLSFALAANACRLTVFAMTTYGGGLFIPFRDMTSGTETYGGGRYLVDSVKNTDGLCIEVSVNSTDVIIDFNYAYNPSCAYDARWACPLAPRENWLPVAVRAGELIYRDER